MIKYQKVKIKKLHPNAVIPKYAKPGDAAMDLTAIAIEVKDGIVTYETGLSVEIPEGYVGLLFCRSSVYKKDLSLSNAVGVIDSGYRGELMFKFRVSDLTKNFLGNVVGKKSPNLYDIGDRVGQIMIIPIPNIIFEEVEDLSDSDRGEGGFGSTGK